MVGHFEDGGGFAVDGAEHFRQVRRVERDVHDRAVVVGQFHLHFAAAGFGTACRQDHGSGFKMEIDAAAFFVGHDRGLANAGHQFGHVDG